MTSFYAAILQFFKLAFNLSFLETGTCLTAQASLELAK